MYVRLTDGDQEDFYIVDNFNRKYGTSAPNRLRDTWKDYYTNGTRADVSDMSGVAPNGNLVRDVNSQD